LDSKLSVELFSGRSLLLVVRENESVVDWGDMIITCRLGQFT
jgi:hypothetical protein